MTTDQGPKPAFLIFNFNHCRSLESVNCTGTNSENTQTHRHIRTCLDTKQTHTNAVQQYIIYIRWCILSFWQKWLSVWHKMLYRQKHMQHAKYCAETSELWCHTVKMSASAGTAFTYHLHLWPPTSQHALYLWQVLLKSVHWDGERLMSHQTRRSSVIEICPLGQRTRFNVPPHTS